MGGEQNRQLASVAQPHDDVKQLVANARVQSNRRLVEKQHPGMGRERASDLEPAPLATAVAGDGAVDQLRKAEGPDKLLGSRPGLGARHVPQPGVQLEVGPPAQPAVDNSILKDDARRLPASYGWTNQSAPT